MFKWMAPLTLGLLAAAPAQAEYRQARTEHFLLTIDDTEENARDFAMRLERFNAGLRLLYGVEDNPDQAYRPIRIFALREEAFKKACGCYSLYGYYSPRSAGSFVVSVYAPDVDRKTKAGQWSSQVVLLHEYSHHFMYSNFPVAYPLWFSEGFAEFNATASFEADGSMILGYPANYRAEGLGRGTQVTLKQMFDPDHSTYPDDPALIYSRGWLLTHMLILQRARDGQLAKYLSAFNRGESGMAAAAGAFGDLKKLDTDLDVYRRGKLAAPLRIPTGKMGPVTVTMMSPGQAEVMPMYVSMMTGIWFKYRGSNAIQAEAVARRYPDDASVQAQVAEIELNAARLDKADAAADRALAIQPDLNMALVIKGSVAVSRASTGKAADPKVWAAARAWYLKANRLDPNAVMPLYLFHASYVAASAKPTPSAVKALMRAAAIAPESYEIRLAVALQALADGDGAMARRALQALAYAPHRSPKDNLPLQAIKLIDDGKLADARKLLMPKAGDKNDD